MSKRQRDDESAARAAAPPLSTPLADLWGKALVITGSTSGLGKEVARCAVLANARGVLVCGRSEERGVAVVEELKALDKGSGCIVEFCRGDVSLPGDCEAMIEAGIRAFGTIDGQHLHADGHFSDHADPGLDVVSGVRGRHGDSHRGSKGGMHALR